jgi:glycosyltransferase involved in cell wall biosynthesis
MAAHLAGIVTDNQRAAASLRDVCDVPCEKIAVVRHPVRARQRFSGPAGRIVLWASRIDTDKRPDLLREIARRLPSFCFHVYGETVLGDDGALARLRAVPNVEYRGRFSTFDDIPAAPYHCFLYTSRWDGLPNVVLEAMRSGLLVIAPDVGGVAEIVNEDTGILVDDVDDPDAYVKAIAEAYSRPEVCRVVAESGQRRITADFTDAAFVETLGRAPGYLIDARQVSDEREAALSPTLTPDFRYK